MVQKRVRFTKSPDNQGIWFEVPYNESWIAEVKQLIPSRERTYSRHLRMWWVSLAYAKQAFTLCEALFGTCYHVPDRTVPKGPHTYTDPEWLNEHDDQSDHRESPQPGARKAKSSESKKPKARKNSRKASHEDHEDFFAYVWENYSPGQGSKSPNGKEDEKKAQEECVRKRSREAFWEGLEDSLQRTAREEAERKRRKEQRERARQSRERRAQWNRSSTLEAYKTLQLMDGSPWELIRAAHKALARVHHPDRGGDVERMKSINAAYDRLRMEVGK